MPSAATLLRRYSTAFLRRDGGLLDALRSELRHELSSSSTQETVQLHQGFKVGNFTVDWNDASTQDLVLSRRFTTGEEIAVSALLGPLTYDGDYLLPRHALMKVCVKKTKPEPILQFDCEVFSRVGEVDSEFQIENVRYLQSASSLKSTGCDLLRFSELRGAFKEYLVRRGIDAELTNFLLLHLSQKEQGQYVAWLRKLENLFKRDA